MKTVSAEYRNALKSGGRVVLLAEFELGGVTRRISNTDTEETHLGNVYAPSYLIEVGEVETSTGSNVNEVDVVIDATDQIFTTLVLTESYMNNEIKITKLVYNSGGTLAGYTTPHVGTITDYEIDPETPTYLTLKTSSQANSSRRVAGIRSNTASQQRFYPGDTALDHSAKATKDTYWGKSEPGGTNIGFNINLDEPAEVIH